MLLLHDKAVMQRVGRCQQRIATMIEWNLGKLAPSGTSHGQASALYPRYQGFD